MIILKPKLDRDWYVEWDTRQDVPIVWGTRESVMRDTSGEITTAHFDRADATGASDDEDIYGHDRVFTYMANGCNYAVKQFDLESVCEALES